MFEKKPEREKRYRYSDTPDGEDVFKKLGAVLKPASGVAVAAGTFDVMAWTQPKGVFPSLARYFIVAAPIMVIPSAFVLTTNGLAGLRQKDDKLNWFAGGIAAGGCCALWSRKIITAINLAMLFGILAVVRKECLQKGYIFIPSDIKVRRGGVRRHLQDLTLTAERPKNWVTGKE